MKQQAGFILGIGSNLDPDLNLLAIMERLLSHFPKVVLSRVLMLPPIGMNSQHHFLNAVAFIETDMKTVAVKAICNTIEIALGRDRSDPEKKIKDRPADLDILTAVTFPKDFDRAAHSMTDEYFLYPLLNELLAYLAGTPFSLSQTGRALSNKQLTFGQTATTIYR